MDQSESTAENLDRRSPMATNRRRLQFSLRGFLIVLTIGCLWFGWKVEQAREQRRLIEIVWEQGGGSWYDWQVDYSGFPARNGPLVRPHAEPAEPTWLRRLVGNDFFHHVEMVIFASSETAEADIVASIPYLTRLRRLRAYPRTELHGR